MLRCRGTDRSVSAGLRLGLATRQGPERASSQPVYSTRGRQWVGDASWPSERHAHERSNRQIRSTLSLSCCLYTDIRVPDQPSLTFFSYRVCLLLSVRPTPSLPLHQARRPEEGIRPLDPGLRCPRRCQPHWHHLNATVLLLCKCDGHSGGMALRLGFTLLVGSQVSHY